MSAGLLLFLLVLAVPLAWVALAYNRLVGPVSYTHLTLPTIYSV